MKSMRTIIAVLAVAHMAAILGFVGYLAGTDRVNRDRLEAVRDIFALTVTDEQAALDAEAATLAANGSVPNGVLDQGNGAGGGSEMPGSGSTSRIERLKTNDDLMREREMRLEKDREILKRSLESENRKLQTARDDLARQEAAFDAKIEEQKRLREDEQFQKMVSVMKGLKPKDLKAKFDAYIADGKIELVVNILDSFDPRTAIKLIGEYKTDEENMLAAELLQRLKDRGLTATSP